MQKLYETYGHCAGREPDGMEKLMPIGHTTQQAQIEIVLDGSGSFRRASVLLDKSARDTMIPCTEESGGRPEANRLTIPFATSCSISLATISLTEAKSPQALLQCQRSLTVSSCGPSVTWAESSHGHPKLDAIIRYVERGQVIADLVKTKVLPVDTDGKLLKRWEGEKDSAPPIFKAIQNTQAPGRRLRPLADRRKRCFGHMGRSCLDLRVDLLLPAGSD